MTHVAPAALNDLSQALVAEVLAELHAAASAAAIALPRRDSTAAVQDAVYIFREIFDLCGDSARALEAASAWPDIAPEIYRLGPRDFIESWVLFQMPEVWDGTPKAAPPPAS